MNTPTPLDQFKARLLALRSKRDAYAAELKLPGGHYRGGIIRGELRTIGREILELERAHEEPAPQERPWAASDSPRKPSPRRFPEDMDQAETARHRVALLDGLAACAMAAPASAELATQQLLALAELAQAPGCLDFRQQHCTPGLLIAAAARTWRAVNAKDLGATLSGYNAAGHLESCLLEELATVATMAGDSVGDLLEALAGLAAGWLYEAQDPDRLGGSRCAVPGPYSEQDAELLAFRFAENFPLELERERGLQEWNEGPLERCPSCAGAAAPDPALGGQLCSTCGGPIGVRE